MRDLLKPAGGALALCAFLALHGPVLAQAPAGNPPAVNPPAAGPEASAPGGAELEATLRKWIEAYHGRDLEGAISIWAPEANEVFPNVAPRTREDIRKDYEHAFTRPEGPGRYRLRVDVAATDGNLGYTRNVWTFTPPGPDARTSTWRSLEIFRRGADGKWQILQSLSAPDPAARPAQ